MKKRFQLSTQVLTTVVVIVLALYLGRPTAVDAQSADAGLRGTAPVGSTVTVKNPATGFVRHGLVDADGTFAIVGLPAGAYVVDAGPGTETNVTLQVASITTLTLTALEEVTVTGTHNVNRPEVRTSQVGAVVSLHDIETTPQVTRNFLEFADAVPGMQFSVDTNGNSTLRSGGQSTNSINVFIDGVGQKSYVNAGGITGQVQTQGNPFPQLAIGEYKVITSNYKAEFDQVSSAAVTAETKSGTNQVHGEVFGNYTNQNLRKWTPAEEFAGVETRSNNKEFGFAVGGPIILDRLHFFATYEGKRFATPVSITPEITTTETGAPIASVIPAGLPALFGPLSKPFKSDLYFGKLDWEPSDRDRFELSSKVRKDTGANIGSGKFAAEHGTNTENTDTRIMAKWQHSADRWFNEVLLTYEDAFYKSVARKVANGAIYDYYGCPALTDCPTINYQDEFFLAGGAGPLDTQDKGQKGSGLQDDLTFSNLTWHGDHTLKMGVKLKSIKLKAIDAGGQGPQFYYIVTDVGTDPQPYYLNFGFPTPGQKPSIESTDKQFGTYFQDDWTVNSRLTVNLGVRWDIEKLPSYLDYVTPADVVSGINSLDPHAQTDFPGQKYYQTLAKGGININDYISNGHNRSAVSNEWQPRVGFSFDLNADQAHVIFGGYGRSYDRNLFDYLQLENNKGALPQYTVAFQTPVFKGGCYPNVPCFPWDPNYLNGPGTLGPLAAGAPLENDLLPNHIKVPYSDQISVGMHNRLGSWQTSATVAYVHSKNGFVFGYGNREPNGTAYTPDGSRSGNGIPGLGLLLLGDNGAETKTAQLLLLAEKPYSKESGWGVSIAYTYSDVKTNLDGHYLGDFARIRDYPFITSNAAPKSRLVVTGSVDGPWGIIVGAKLTIATPTPLLYDVTRPITGDTYYQKPVSVLPDNKIGYKDFDLQFTKNIELPRDQSLYVRADFLNFFNESNFDPDNGGYTKNFGDGSNAPIKAPVINPQGNILGTPFTFKLSMGYKF